MATATDTPTIERAEETEAPSEQWVVLDIGCGRKDAPFPEELSGKDWKRIRIDPDESVNPDIVARATNLEGHWWHPSEGIECLNEPVNISFADEFADAVWCKSVLDHLYPHDVYKALREFYRVLKPGGVCIIVVYDAIKLFKTAIAQGLEEPLYEHNGFGVTAFDQIYGYRPDTAKGNEWVAKRCGFTPETLSNRLTCAGFDKGEICDSDMWLKGGLLATVTKRRRGE